MFGIWKLSSAAESKPFQSRSTAEIPGLAKREEPEERRSRSKFKYTFLIDSDAELLMYYLIPCIRFGSMKSSASELGLIKIQTVTTTTKLSETLQKLYC